MNNAINELRVAKEFMLLKDYEQAENKIANALEYMTHALEYLEHRGKAADIHPINDITGIAIDAI